MRRNKTAGLLFIHLALIATRDGAWETAARLMAMPRGGMRRTQNAMAATAIDFKRLVRLRTFTAHLHHTPFLRLIRR